MTTIEVQPIAGQIGADIVGIDLSRDLDDATIAEVRAALLEWKVVFFRDQDITPAQQIAFGRRFGSVTPAHPTLKPEMPEYPEILTIDNQQYTDDGARNYEKRFHTDVTFVENPPMASILRAVTVPPRGGDTQWSNLAQAYAELSPPLQQLADDLHAVHHNQLHLARGDDRSTIHSKFESETRRAVHPVVRVHPETGERCLFVNPGFTSHLVELSRAESRQVLDLLYWHITQPQFTVRFRWFPGSIAFWDNRATAHLVPGDVPPGMRRTLHRITLAGDTPVGVDGERSYSLDGAAFS